MPARQAKQSVKPIEIMRSDFFMYKRQNEPLGNSLFKISMMG